MLEERLERVRRGLEVPPWDELRETRVLGGVLEEVRQSRRRRRIRLVGSGSAAVLAAAAALLLASTPTPTPTTARMEEPATAPTPAVAAVEAREQPAGSVLTLSDGSRAELSPSAAVEALEQSAERVAVRQSRGLVRYDVTRRPERAFVVHAGEVEVRVLGTAFSVELLEGGVEVSVERGHVAVQDAARRVELRRGESVFLAEAPEAAELAELAPITDEAATPRAKAPARKNTAATPGVDELLARTDAARQAGRLRRAVQALSTLTEHYGDDPRAISAWFTLGRVERDRGRYQASARAFERCFGKQPAGTLAEDALAEAARAWAAGDDPARARAAATRYLRRYPGGTHATSMHALVTP